MSWAGIDLAAANFKELVIVLRNVKQADFVQLKKQLREAILAEAQLAASPLPIPPPTRFISLEMFDDVMVGSLRSIILAKQFYPGFKEECLLGQSKNPWQQRSRAFVLWFAPQISPMYTPELDITVFFVWDGIV